MNAAATRVLILAVACCGLAGCGFKLAGSAELPPQLSTIHLAEQGLSKSQRDQLSERLTQAGANLVARDDSNAVRLSVALNVLPDRRLASSASNGKTVDRLARSLDFSLKSATGELLAPAQTLLQQKEIVLDDDNLLASERERISVIGDLEEALFKQLIRQLMRI